MCNFLNKQNILKAVTVASVLTVSLSFLLDSDVLSVIGLLFITFLTIYAFYNLIYQKVIEDIQTKFQDNPADEYEILFNEVSIGTMNAAELGGLHMDSLTNKRNHVQQLLLLFKRFKNELFSSFFTAIPVAFFYFGLLIISLDPLTFKRAVGTLLLNPTVFQSNFIAITILLWVLCFFIFAFKELNRLLFNPRNWFLTGYFEDVINQQIRMKFKQTSKDGYVRFVKVKKELAETEEAAVLSNT